MRETMTLEVSDEALRRARALALRLHRRVEEVLSEWLDRMVAEPPIEALDDAEVLALCERELPPSEADELRDLQDAQREGALDDSGRARLDALGRAYRRALVQKAQALAVARARGLRPSLS